MEKRPLPPVGFRFAVKFYDSRTGLPYIENDGFDACFQSVSGLSVNYESETVGDGGNTRYMQKLPKRPVFPDLVLKRGLLTDSRIFDWFNSSLVNSQVKVAPLDVEVELLDEEGATLLNFRFTKAWPKKWSITDFNAMEGQIVMETLELTYQYFRVTRAEQGNGLLNLVSTAADFLTP